MKITDIDVKKLHDLETNYYNVLMDGPNKFEETTQKLWDELSEIYDSISDEDMDEFCCL